MNNNILTITTNKYVLVPNDETKTVDIEFATVDVAYPLSVGNDENSVDVSAENIKYFAMNRMLQDLNNKIGDVQNNIVSMKSRNSYDVIKYRSLVDKYNELLDVAKKYKSLIRTNIDIDSVKNIEKLIAFMSCNFKSIEFIGVYHMTDEILKYYVECFDNDEKHDIERVALKKCICNTINSKLGDEFPIHIKRISNETLKHIVASTVKPLKYNKNGISKVNSNTKYKTVHNDIVKIELSTFKQVLLATIGTMLKFSATEKSATTKNVHSVYTI